MSVTTTLELNWDEGRSSSSNEPPIPGLVAVLLAGQPVCAALPLVEDAIELGRGADFGPLRLDDNWMSRHHATVRIKDGRWVVRDLGSRNGTHLDGAPVDREQRVDQAVVVRTGASLFLLCDDIRPFQAQPTSVSGDMVVGPTLAKVFGQIDRASRFGTSLHIVGESGSGKELAARAFHDFGRRAAGPFIAVNCAAIPEGVAERLLFGARKGAFSGADAHAEGYVQAADGGTLFLDEVAELDLAVQAKLLRVLEMREVLALGASRPVPVDLHICSATHRDLRVEAAAGRLREDLYFRLSRPEVRVPPLRERREEIPLLASRALAEVHGRLRAHPLLIEACLLRDWPGNVRELIAEVRTAGQAALIDDGEMVEVRHLRDEAGQRLVTRDDQPTPSRRPRSGNQPTPEEIEAVLQAEGGNVSSSARALGLHRTQLRRLLARHEIDPKAFA